MTPSIEGRVAVWAGRQRGDDAEAAVGCILPNEAVCEMQAHACLRRAGVSARVWRCGRDAGTHPGKQIRPLMPVADARLRRPRPCPAPRCQERTESGFLVAAYRQHSKLASSSAVAARSGFFPRNRNILLLDYYDIKYEHHSQRKKALVGKTQHSGIWRGRVIICGRVREFRRWDGQACGSRGPRG